MNTFEYTKNNQPAGDTGSREEFLSALSRIMAAINSSLKLEEVLSILCSEIVQVLDISGASIYVFDAPSLELRLKASTGLDTAGLEKISVEDSRDLVGRSFWTGRSVVVNARTESGEGMLMQMPDAYLERGINSLLAMPLIRNVRGLGVLVLTSSQSGRFAGEDLERARMLADHAAIAAKNAMLFEQERQRSEQLKLAIQEAHHRIKNNLQTVSVLLSLQMSECDEPNARQALEHSMDRINAISLVHELLSRDFDVRVINTKQLLDKLITIVATAAGPTNEGTSVIKVDAEDVLISSRRATAMALIAHELVANALEHGVAGISEGAIEVSLHKSGNTVTFSVKDNGEGLPEGFDPYKDGRIGLNIVRTLAQRDLSGRIEFEECEPGFKTTVHFDDAGVAGDG